MIKFLVMYFDGTLTDGKIYMGVDGECFKAFDIKDGYALHTLLKENGIIPVIITARKSPMVEHRCKELGVTEIHQGVMKKLNCLMDILKRYSTNEQQFDLSNVAYIGDDLLDLQCIKPIKEAGGITGCPLNAVNKVVAMCDYVAPDNGGEGAVRDFTEFLIERNDSVDSNVSDIEQRCMEAISFLTQLKDEELSLGKHVVNDGFFYNIQEYVTNGNKEKHYESHRKYIDIQLLLSGEEIMQVTDIVNLRVSSSYDENSDCIFYNPSDNASGVVLRPGSIMILYPKDGHRSMSLKFQGCKVKKIVGKVVI